MSIPNITVFVIRLLILGFIGGFLGWICYVVFKKAKEEFNIYAYRGNDPNDDISVKVKYKKVVTFFIGGAADKEPFYGQSKTNIVKKRVQEIFDISCTAGMKELGNKRACEQNKSRNHLKIL